MTEKDAKTAKFDDVIINKLDGGKIEIYQECGNTIAALKDIATKLEFAYEEGWNTQTMGAKVAAFVEENKEHADKLLKTPKCKKEVTNDNEDKTLHKYYVKVKAENLWRFDTVILENADEDVIEQGFDEEESWTNIVGDAKCLYTYVEDMQSALEGDDWYGFDDEEGVSKVLDMIGEEEVDDNGYFPDAEEDFSLIIMDEDEEVIEEIDGDDIPSFSCEQRYALDPDVYCEEDVEYALMKNFLDKSYDSEEVNHVFTPASADEWYWLNVQKCSAVDSAIYELEIEGDFDASKLSAMKVLVEEPIKGLMSVECIAKILYDGEPLYECESGSADEEECTNFFIKMDEDGKSSDTVYDMTNKDVE